eukprot:scaffold207_cov409-Prasinococcus_capsulatus_cf.AAC.38
MERGQWSGRALRGPHLNSSLAVPQLDSHAQEARRTELSGLQPGGSALGGGLQRRRPWLTSLSFLSRASGWQVDVEKRSCCPSLMAVAGCTWKTDL